MTTPGEGTADPAGAGATNNPPSEAEVTKLQTQIATLTTEATEHTTALDAANVSITELQSSNKKFADDAAGLARQSQQLVDAQRALEESRKTSTDLQTQLEESNTKHQVIADQVITRRRQDIVSKFNLPEDHVAGLDEAGLTTLENTLPHVTLANASDPPPKVVGMGLENSGPGETDVSKMTDSERANRIIERLKAPATKQ